MENHAPNCCRLRRRGSEGLRSLAALLALALLCSCAAPALAQPAPLPGDMKAHLARHKAVQDAIGEARKDLEARKTVAPAEQGVVNYFLTQLDLIEALSQNAFDLSFVFYDRILASEKAGKIVAGYVGQRLNLLADKLFELELSFQKHLEAVPALQGLPGIARFAPALTTFIEATGAHAEDILSRAG